MQIINNSNIIMVTAKDLVGTEHVKVISFNLTLAEKQFHRVLISFLDNVTVHCIYNCVDYSIKPWIIS